MPKQYLFKSKKQARADRLVAAELPFVRRGFLNKLFRKKEIKIGGVAIASDTTVPAGATLTIFLPDPRTHFSSMTGTAIIFENDDCIAFDKAAGTPSVEGVGTRGTSVKNSAEKLLGIALTAVHRLDAGTSGVIVFAKNATMARKLETAFRNRTAEKIYDAVVSTKPREPHGTISAPLKRIGQKMQIRADGLSAETEWKLVKKIAAGWLIECRPKSGRTHQIRVHLGSIGCPIVGDRLYGGAPHPRMLLHARALRIGTHALHAEAPTEFGE